LFLGIWVKDEIHNNNNNSTRRGATRREGKWKKGRDGCCEGELGSYGTLQMQDAFCDNLFAS
jgi:hypothetical protein